MSSKEKEISKDKSSIWRPFTQMQTSSVLGHVLSAKGASFKIKREGQSRSVIDAISSWWVITHGHCENSIVKAVQEQAETLDQVLFAEFSHEKAERLSFLILKHLPPSLSSVFFFR